MKQRQPKHTQQQQAYTAQRERTPHRQDFKTRQLAGKQKLFGEQVNKIFPSFYERYRLY